jgi:dihydrodipicolinate synthase/N-acetylneuraminate lyase
MVEGGEDCISVASNVAPELCRDMYLACKRGRIGRAQQLGADVKRLSAALSREPSPAPLKYALSRLDLMSPTVRLPLVEASAQSKSELDALLSDPRERHRRCMIASSGPPRPTACLHSRGWLRESHNALVDVHR